MNGFYFCRFQKNDLERLSSGLCLPDKYTCVQGTLATGPEALQIMLKRLAYPNRWCDLASFFGRGESELSLIFNMVS